ncbi:MAG: hypothetical protein Fur0018_01340 [Anaerolineales bacterium]
MDKATLLTAMENSRTALLDALEDLPDEAFERPYEGDWTLKDTLAHLTQWEAQLITALWQLKGGQKPTTAHFTNRSRDEINAEWYAQSKNRPLDIIWQDFVTVRDQTILRVEEIPERNMNDEKRYAWLQGATLIEWIARYTIGHDEKHLGNLTSWRKENHL